jgi:hypothetical protein
MAYKLYGSSRFLYRQGEIIINTIHPNMPVTASVNDITPNAVCVKLFLSAFSLVVR